MPNWTLGDIMSRATARIGFRDEISASDASFYANMAYAQVADEVNPSGLERVAFASVSSGQSRISPPANMKELVALSYFTTAAGSGRTIERVSVEEMDARGFLPSATPTHYAEYRDWIELWPSPNSAYSIHARYHSYATDMLGTGQVPSVETQWRPGIMYLTEAFLWEHIGAIEEGVAARARYEAYMQAQETTQARRQAARTNFAVKVPMRPTRRVAGDTDW